MKRLIALPLIALTLQGCILDKLDDPSKPTPAQQAMVQQQAMIVETAVMTEVSVVECQPVFRVTKCIDGEPRGWWE